MKRTLLIILFTLFAALTALAADVTGTWIAQVPARGQTMETTFNFKSEGDKLTGTITNQFMSDVPISDGKVEGDSISFVQNVEFNGNAFKISYKGKVAGSEITFTREIEGRGGPTTFTAKKK
jgi:opacity protein-like surface antigen